MKKWEILFSDAAKEDLKKIAKKERKRIIEKLEWLQQNFERISPSPLSHKWRGFFKLRIGKWRIIYKIHHKEAKIIIYLIGHRSRIYKRPKQ